MIPRPLRLPSLALVLLTAPSLGGGGPENLLIIADPTDEFSIYAANYYRNARNVPPQNVLFIEPGATDYTAFVDINLSALSGSIATRALDDHIDYILVMPSIDVYRVSAPGLVSDPCPGAISNFSITKHLPNVSKIRKSLKTKELFTFSFNSNSLML